MSLENRYPLMMFLNSWDNWEIAIGSKEEQELSAKGFSYHGSIKQYDHNDNGIADGFDQLTIPQIKERLDEAGVDYAEKDKKSVLLDKYLDYLEKQAKDTIPQPPEIPS